MEEVAFVKRILELKKIPYPFHNFYKWSLSWDLSCAYLKGLITKEKHDAIKYFIEKN